MYGILNLHRGERTFTPNTPGPLIGRQHDDHGVASTRKGSPTRKTTDIQWGDRGWPEYIQ